MQNETSEVPNEVAIVLLALEIMRETSTRDAQGKRLLDSYKSAHAQVPVLSDEGKKLFATCRELARGLLKP